MGRAIAGQWVQHPNLSRIFFVQACELARPELPSLKANNQTLFLLVEETPKNSYVLHITNAK